MKLLTRDDFRESVFKRDNNLCVVCKKTGVDAHHIIERRLFEDFGYYIDNGCTLCANCHILAEQTILTPAQLRVFANIERVVLPDHLYHDQDYDKWGNIIIGDKRLKGELYFDDSVRKIISTAFNISDLFIDRYKYPRTYHLPNSLGVTKNDKKMKDYSSFYNKRILITEKMDGENITGYYDGYIHARSIDSKKHESRSWVKNYLQSKLFQLPKGWRICGENLYATHSIFYNNLETYFYVFSIWDEYNNCLSVDKTIEYCILLDLVFCPILYSGDYEPGIIETYSKFNIEDQEGIVVRNHNKFNYKDFKKNVGKYVREGHVQTSQHWMREKLVKNKILENLG